MSPKDQALKLKTRDGFELDALCSSNGPSAPAIVFAHGMCVDKDGEGIFVRAYEELARLGFNVLRFDFRAHGKSQGDSIHDFNVSGELLDLEAAVGLMKARGCTGLGLAGASFGGGLAALYAGQQPGEIQALFLANPLIDYRGMTEPVAPWPKSVFSGWRSELKQNGFVSLKADWSDLRMGPRFFEDLLRYRPFETLKNYAGPLMAVHGDRDDMVDLESTRTAFEKHPNPLKHFEVVRGSGHGFHAEPFETQVAGLCAGFFRKHLEPK